MTSYRAGGMVPNYPQGTEYYNHDQAKIMAATYYKLGSELYQQLLPQISIANPKKEDVWQLWPAFINLSFSCEIILKLFYENDHGCIRSGHRLYSDLFNKLSEASQLIISDVTVNFIKTIYQIDYTKNEFIEDLKKSEKTFADERYVFEIKQNKIVGSLQCSFLNEFSKALNILAKNLQ